MHACTLILYQIAIATYSNSSLSTAIAVYYYDQEFIGISPS